MSLETNYNNTTSSTTSEPSLEEINQQLQDAYAAMREAAQSNTKDRFQGLLKTVAQIQKTWQEHQNNPAYAQNAKPVAEIVDQLSELNDIIQEAPADPNDPEAKATKDAAAAPIKNFLKQIRDSLSNRATEKALAKAEASEAIAEESRIQDQKVGERIQKLIGNITKGSNAWSRSAEPTPKEVAAQTAAREVAQKFKGLVKSEGKPQSETAKNHAGPELKKPARQIKGETKLNLAGVEDDNLEAFATEVEEKEPVTPEDETRSASETEGAEAELETPAIEVSEADVELARQSVLQTLGAKVIVVAGQILDPGRDIIKTIRETLAETNLLLADGEDSTQALGAAQFAKRGAVRQAFLRLSQAVISGKLRDGTPEDIREEVRRQQQQSERIANGEAQLNTTPDSVQENGQVSPAKARETFQEKFEVKPSNEFATDDEHGRHQFSFRQWSSKVRQGTVAFLERAHVKDLLVK